MKTKDKKLSKKLSEIITLIYRFRFLSRDQIQTILQHKYHSRVLSWLNKLTKEKYLVKFYDKSFTTTASVYCLGNNGRTYLKEIKNVNLKPLSRVWKEKKYSKEFQEHCQLLADIYISLKDQYKDKLKFHTKTDLYGIENLIQSLPDAYFIINDKRFFLDIFDDIRPVFMRKRIKEYLEYYNSDQWHDNTDKPFPYIILICPNRRIQNHLKFFIQNKLNGDDEPVFYLTNKDEFKEGFQIKNLYEVDPDE